MLDLLLVIKNTDRVYKSHVILLLNLADPVSHLRTIFSTIEQRRLKSMLVIYSLGRQIPQK